MNLFPLTLFSVSNTKAQPATNDEGRLPRRKWLTNWRHPILACSQMKNEMGDYLDWKKDILLWPLVAGSILVLNILFTLWVVMKHERQTAVWAGGIYSLARQRCSKLHVWVWYVDLAINIASGLLIMASNSGCLSFARIVYYGATDKFQNCCGCLTVPQENESTMDISIAGGLILESTVCEIFGGWVQWGK